MTNPNEGGGKSQKRLEPFLPHSLFNPTFKGEGRREKGKGEGGREKGEGRRGKGGSHLRLLLL